MTDPGFIIGRAPDADLRVDDEYASPRHARVWRDEHGQAWIEDLGSTNGTWVGADRVRGPRRIFPGDRIRIGKTVVPWSVQPGALTRAEVERLATYNAERARGQQAAWYPLVTRVVITMTASMDIGSSLECKLLAKHLPPYSRPYSKADRRAWAVRWMPDRCFSEEDE